MESEYMKDRTAIQSYEVYLNYDHVCLVAGNRTQHFSPPEALALLKWLEQHQPVFEQAVNDHRRQELFLPSERA
jgi:hypothetical protein